MDELFFLSIASESDNNLWCPITLIWGHLGMGNRVLLGSKLIEDYEWATCAIR